MYILNPFCCSSIRYIGSLAETIHPFISILLLKQLCDLYAIRLIRRGNGV